jgi:hypothetical protein
MAKVTLIVELDLDRPLRNAEDERYLCASIEEGIDNGWYDFLMNEAAMPSKPRRATKVRLSRREAVAA